MIQIAQIILALGLAACAVLAVYRSAPFVYDAFTAKISKIDAECALLSAQAAHVAQTAEVEKNTLEATIKAHEKQGGNKLRTEIARLDGDLAKIEALIGSKIKGAISLAEHEAQLATSRHIITQLEGVIERLSAPVPSSVSGNGNV